MRPYVHKILVVIEPLLIDEDYYARVEGREIISNLAKVCTFINNLQLTLPTFSQLSLDPFSKMHVESQTNKIDICEDFATLLVD